MTWVAVAIGGSALIGGAASLAGSKKQADASKKAAQMQEDHFGVINAQQQPYIQSGYGALSKLNTLMGLSPRPMAPPVAGTGSMPPPGGLTVNNGPSGPGVRLPPRLEGPQSFGAPEGASNLPLRHILSLRAKNGDGEAARVLRGMV